MKLLWTLGFAALLSALSTLPGGFARAERIMGIEASPCDVFAAADPHDRVKASRCAGLRDDFRKLARLRFRKPSRGFTKLFGPEPDGVFHFVRRTWPRTVIFREDVGDNVMAAAGPDAVLIRTRYFEQPLAVRLSVLVHEAKHTQPGDRGHSPCPPAYAWEYQDTKVPLPETAGQLACDFTPLDSYGVGFLFGMALANSCQSSICTDELKTMALQGAREAILHIADPKAVGELLFLTKSP